jgi:lipopolysaccharide biosynthesis regulator YciM
MLDSLLAWLLFPLGAALGWYMARRAPRNLSGRLGVDALSGIDHLVNDDPDQAIAALLKAAELDSEAVELHLTLGTLFRKRGQVDRALRLHEGLLGRAGLVPEQLRRARFELAQDHLQAGLYDRAEQAFLALAAEGIDVIPSLEAVVSIYERSHDWSKALEASQRLEAASGRSRQPISAHYHCELAEELRARKDYVAAQRAVRRALDQDAACARASLLEGRICEEQSDWQAAIRAYRRVPEQDPRLVPEVLQPLWRCTRETGSAEAFLQWLDELQEVSPSGAASVMRAELMQQVGYEAKPYLVEEFRRRPSWPLLERLAGVEAAGQPGTQDSAESGAAHCLREGITGLARLRPRYRCGNCGMQPGLLFWQCPSCHQWGSVTPSADALEGVRAAT